MIGRGASWLARRPRMLTAGVVGGAATAGVVRGLTQSSALGDIQEQSLGDRQAVQAVVRGSIGAALSPRDDIMGAGDYYYGQNVAFPSVGASSGRNIPVGGEIVWGMYNERRR